MNDTQQPLARPLFHITEVPPAQAPMDLLLLADPSEAKVRAYLAHCRCFVLSAAGVVTGACAVQQTRPGVHELMSIAVRETQQKTGAGTALLRWLIDTLRQSGARQLEVGTGTFGFQLAFYQKQGFRVSAIDHDFFLRHYDTPLYENGIQHKDMLRLTLNLAPAAADGIIGDQT